MLKLPKSGQGEYEEKVKLEIVKKKKKNKKQVKPLNSLQ